MYNLPILVQYDLSKSELSSRTLLLTVWDWNRFGTNQFLGEIRLPLASLDSLSQDGLDQWYLLPDKVYIHTMCCVDLCTHNLHSHLHVVCVYIVHV